MSTTACPVCGDPSTSLRYACPACSVRTQRRLRELQDYRDVLRATLTPSSRGLDPLPGPRGYRSSPPMNLDIVVALDPRSHASGAGPDDDADETVLSITGSLHRVAEYVAEERYRAAVMGSIVPRPYTLDVLASYLWIHTEWCCWQLWAADYVGMIRTIHGQIRRQAHDAPPTPLGPCRTETCGGTVMPRPGRGGACPTCGRSYDGLELARLAYTPPAPHQEAS
ncbi:hypothetical protein [Saccharothrix sp. HUAS TT1]|uniref:hypothetical protein n=1 Tax=unclassified Saccharothrix TaxID=2593673 RepID=UPI00345B8CD0